MVNRGIGKDLGEFAILLGMIILAGVLLKAILDPQARGYRCPNCSLVISKNWISCPRCNVALDWSGVS